MSKVLDKRRKGNDSIALALKFATESFGIYGNINKQAWSSER